MLVWHVFEFELTFEASVIEILDTDSVRKQDTFAVVILIQSLSSVMKVALTETFIHTSFA